MLAFKLNGTEWKLELFLPATVVAMFAGHIVNTEMLVTQGLSMQAILGLYFLEAHQCVINTEQRVLHMHRYAIPLVQGKQTSGSH